MPGMVGLPPEPRSAEMIRCLVQLPLMHPTEKIGATIGTHGAIMTITPQGAADRIGLTEDMLVLEVDGGDSTTREGLLSSIQRFQAKGQSLMPLLMSVPANHNIRADVRRLPDAYSPGTAGPGTPSAPGFFGDEDGIEEENVHIRQYRVDLMLETPEEELGAAIAAGGRVIRATPGGAFDRAGLVAGTTVVDIWGNDIRTAGGLHAALNKIREARATRIPLLVEVAAQLVRRKVVLDHPNQALGLHYERRADGAMQVIGLQPGSPVDRAGIQKGMAFYTINSIRINTREDLDRALQSVRSGKRSVLVCEMWDFDNQTGLEEQSEGLPRTPPLEQAPHPPRTPSMTYEEDQPSPFTWDEGGVTLVPSHATRSGMHPSQYNPRDLSGPSADEIPEDVIQRRADAPLVIAPSTVVQYPPPPFPQGGGVGGPVTAFAPRRGFGAGRGYFDANPSAAFRRVRAKPDAPRGGLFPAPHVQVKRDVRPDYFSAYPTPNFVHVPGEGSGSPRFDTERRAGRVGHPQPAPMVLPQAPHPHVDRYGGVSNLTVLI
eukprot:TRINITY_DN21581_c0_g4_i1.p1 TRINITY_DN21581_c0_g4~~TRINITY_DN21581_c0_g4_i1.p1  ORF type:complete len:554 (+),score=140.34 TRINITY_DN21581_c0_g4_i1:29-1663(+)